MGKVDFKKKEEGVYTLSVVGMVCPHPQLYTKKALTKLAQDELLEVVFDNLSSAEAIESIKDVAGFEIVARGKEINNNHIWTLKKV
jgi:tRNA 2-thiouridine synthesizing protein A